MLDEDIQKSVDDFYKREDISINVPNKKVINRNNESKYILQTSYVGCYEKWKEKNQLENNSPCAYSEETAFTKLLV